MHKCTKHQIRNYFSNIILPYIGIFACTYNQECCVLREYLIFVSLTVNKGFYIIYDE